MRRRAILPLSLLALCLAACGRDDAPAAGTPAAAGSTTTARGDGGRPDQDMKVTVDTQRVEPTGADTVQAPDAGD
jgi:hypothetical protein